MMRRNRARQETALLNSRITLALLVLLLSGASPCLANSETPSGRLLYRQNCMACHGVDGTGAPASTVGFDVPLPDFTDSSFASREAAGDWVVVAREGGPARGFSEIMPAFGDALTEAELLAVVTYIHTFYTDKRWPRGELNLPRALVTTKAFPEDEFVVTSSYRHQDPGKLSNKVIYERRLGPLNQVELIVPFGWADQSSSSTSDTDWQSSVGDIGLAFKRVMFHSMETGSIVSVGAEVFLPTGDKDRRFGSDTTVFEPYLAYGQILPAECFFQAQTGFILPYDSQEREDEVFWRGVLGHSFFTGPYERAWSPMVEILGSKKFTSRVRTQWDIVPQIQINLNTRQHVRLAAGVRIPLNDKDVRKPEYMVYLLWDWFDGGFFEGW